VSNLFIPVRKIILVGGVVGLLVLAYGLYTVFDLTNRFNELALIPPPPDLAKASQAEQMLFAQQDMTRRNLLRQRLEASSIIGVGAAILGGMALLYLRVTELPPQKRSPGRPSATDQA
jgi:hypothetical protein